MRFSFFAREPALLGMLDDMAAQVRRGAAQFFDMVQQFDDLERRAQDLKRQEKVCDELVAGVLKDLNRAFSLPLDREDVHALAIRLDDVMDTMEEAAFRFVAFRIARPTATAVTLVRILDECCRQLELAVRLCRDRGRATELQNHLREVVRLENDADEVYRKTEAALFADGAGDVLMLIKWRELYAWLEDAVDACKKVAHVLSEIVIKAG